MELTYSLDESDIIALADYRLHYMPAVRRRLQLRRLGYLVGFSLLAVGAWMLGYPIVLVVLSLFLAAALFLFYPTYYAWNVHRRIRKAYRNEKMRSTLGSRTLRSTHAGLEEISNVGEVKINWEAIESIAVTAERAFVTVAGAPPAMVISRGRVTAGNYDDLIAACQERMRAKSS